MALWKRQSAKASGWSHTNSQNYAAKNKRNKILGQTKDQQCNQIYHHLKASWPHPPYAQNGTNVRQNSGKSRMYASNNFRCNVDRTNSSRIYQIKTAALQTPCVIIYFRILAATNKEKLSKNRPNDSMSRITNLPTKPTTSAILISIITWVGTHALHLIA